MCKTMSRKHRGRVVFIQERQLLGLVLAPGLHRVHNLASCLPTLAICPCALCRSATARKRLAVPFRAAHVPAERSEYAQPDTALCLTTLAYYYDGLTQQQLLDALKVLLSLGLNAQRECYKEWLKMAAGKIPAGLTLPNGLHCSVEQALT
jgi:hypothetical protein